MGYLFLGGAVAAVLAGVAWWLRRHQRAVDDYYEREYREPPVFNWPDGGGWSGQ